VGQLGCVCAAVLGSLLALAPSMALGASNSDTSSSDQSTTNSLTVLPNPPTESRTVNLDPLPRHNGHRFGRLTILISSVQDGTIVPLYLREAGSSPILLSASSKPVSLTGRPGQINAKAGRTIPLQFQFDLAKNKLPSSLDGTLLLREVSGKTTRTSLAVGVAASIAAVPDIQFEPDSVTQNEVRSVSSDGWRFRWGSKRIEWRSDGSATVQLTGPGAARFARLHPNFSTSTRLGNDSGGSMVVTFTQPKVVGQTVNATLRFGTAKPGEYKGTLQVGQNKDGPKLPLTIRVRDSLWVPFLLVLASSIVGGLLPGLTKTAGRRQSMLAELRSMLREYEKAQANRDKSPVHWSIEDVVGKPPWFSRKWTAIPGLYGASGLYSEIRSARTEADLDELEIRLSGLKTTIQNWLRLYEPARALDHLYRQRVDKRGNSRWSTTALYNETGALVSKLRRQRPATEKDTDDLLHRVLEQTTWYGTVLDVWQRLARAQKDPCLSDAKQRSSLANLPLAEVVDTPRTDKNADQLATKLADLVARAKDIDPQFEAPEAIADADDSELMKLAAPTEQTAVSYSLMRDVASAENEDQSAVKDVKQAEEDSEPERMRLAVREIDIAMSAVLAAGAVLVYVTGIYSDTWGSTKDYLTAITVGFGTQVVVQWAALPIFRSSLSGKLAGADKPKKPDENGPPGGSTAPEEKDDPGGSGEAGKKEATSAAA
jgi:hypothetical protein